MNDELYEALSNYIESCHRVGKHDADDNIDYFMKENDHMDITRNEVEELYYQIDN